MTGSPSSIAYLTLPSAIRNFAMHHFILISALAASALATTLAPYAQCGGKLYNGSTKCGAGFHCESSGEYYSQCVPDEEQVQTPETVAPYQQCGGNGWTGRTQCTPGHTCQSINESYSHCVLEGSHGASPSSASATPAPSDTTSGSSSSTTTPAPDSTSTATSSGSSDSSLPGTTASSTTGGSDHPSSPLPTSIDPTPTGRTVRYGGVNLAGLEFGMGIDGRLSGGYYMEVEEAEKQIEHFVNDIGLNAFRIPVGWQYLVGNTCGGPLDPAYVEEMDVVMQKCIKTAELCIIDMHNYARWDSGIIGQDGPPSEYFVDVWVQLAKKYAASPNVAFGLMNEPVCPLAPASAAPQSVSPFNTQSSARCRHCHVGQGGASGRDGHSEGGRHRQHDSSLRYASPPPPPSIISALHRLLTPCPGNTWSFVGTFTSDGSSEALMKITNPDSSTDNLIFEVHSYLDWDHSGKSSECSRDNVAEFEELGAFLRKHKRQAMLTETGASSNANCEKLMLNQLTVLNKYNDVYLGWTGWSAGMFSTDDVNAMRQKEDGSDQGIVTNAFAVAFGL